MQFNRLKLLTLIFSILWLVDPEVVVAKNIQIKPLEPPSGSAATLFEQLSFEHTGIRFRNELHEDRLSDFMDNGSGVTIGDYDGDGLPDLYLVSLDGPNRLYRNLGGFRFEDVTGPTGVDGGNGLGTGASFADVDNDGDLDLYVCNRDQANLLYINLGDGRFEESAARLGVDYAGASNMAAFADYDLDGDLDLYLLNNLLTASRVPPKITGFDQSGAPIITEDLQGQTTLIGKVFTQHGEGDILYRNDGQKGFVNVTKTAGLEPFGMGLSAVWWDMDRDGWPDLFIGNDLYGPDRLYHNQRDGSFRDVLPLVSHRTSWYSMGSDFGDINNDGWFDYLVGDMSPTTHEKQMRLMGNMSEQGWFLEYGRPRQAMRNTLFLNSGMPRFMEAAFLTGLDSTGWTWSVKFADLDNDGLQDVYFTNGHARQVTDSDLQPLIAAAYTSGDIATLNRLIREAPPLEEENLVFKNLGDYRFQARGHEWGLALRGVSHGAAWADFDQDGDLDLAVNNLNAEAAIYRNTATGDARSIVHLEGVESNRFGIGAIVTVDTKLGKQVRQLSLSRGYLSTDEPMLHFGLGDAKTIDSLMIEWPSGVRQQFTSLPVNHVIRIREQLTPIKRSDAQLPPRFESYEQTAGLIDQHVEAKFDDFANQPMLSNRLSRLGPGHAFGDADGDGDFDLFVGGARSQAGRLYLNDRGRFRLQATGPWMDHAEFEDMGVLWLDTDSDGDFDLFVVSGSQEYPVNDKRYRDRLYLNQGEAGFIHAPMGSLPDFRDSGSAAVAADFDRDGDLDIFVGSRLVPGHYPDAPISRLLRNDHGRFVTVEDATELLSSLGMVTAATWSDANSDGWLDLLIATEWGSIKVLLNRNGRLELAQGTGIDSYLGWWNGITAADLDNDGDMDYVVTNFGLNTKYQANRERPIRLYVNDFDGDGHRDLVEAKSSETLEYPVRGRSCSVAAMPALGERFPSFRAFAQATLKDIYGGFDLQSSDVYSVNTLEHAVLINDGNARFTLRALPRLAQIAPGFGVASTDFDGDARVDIVIAQNFFGPQRETGRMDGGLGAYLQNHGSTQFKTDLARASGILVPGDATSLTTIDIDGDRLPDTVFATNNGPLRVFRNQRQRDSAPLVIRLSGLPGNPQGIGARVNLWSQGLPPQTAELYAGSGYISQSAAELYFSVRTPQSSFDIEVLWPDGIRTSDVFSYDRGRVLIQHPGL
jgi:hypothetical protein